MPNVGPSDGCRSESIDRCPSAERPWASPIDVVVLPSPSGVGVTAVMTMYFAGAWIGQGGCCGRSDLGDVRAVGLQVLRCDAGRGGDLLDRQEVGGVADFEVAQDFVHTYSMTVIFAHA